jgi:hypothetical protein
MASLLADGARRIRAPRKCTYFSATGGAEFGWLRGVGVGQVQAYGLKRKGEEPKLTQSPKVRNAADAGHSFWPHAGRAPGAGPLSAVRASHLMGSKRSAFSVETWFAPSHGVRTLLVCFSARNMSSESVTAPHIADNSSLIARRRGQ